MQDVLLGADAFVFTVGKVSFPEGDQAAVA